MAPKDTHVLTPESVTSRGTWAFADAVTDLEIWSSLWLLWVGPVPSRGALYEGGGEEAEGDCARAEAGVVGPGAEGCGAPDTGGGQDRVSPGAAPDTSPARP